MARLFKVILMVGAVAAAALASAFTFNVSAPTSGTITDPTFLGTSNTVSFTGTGVDKELTVTVVATNLDTNTTITKEQKFTPDADQKVTGSIALNFSQGSTPDGSYKIDVTAKYANDANSAQTVTIDNLKLDLTKPKILEFNPGTNTFVGAGIVHIVASVNEPNFKNYTVQVNGSDIPNNTGTSLINGSDLAVDWDTTGIVTDGPQTITIEVTDKANNKTVQTMTVTLDRVKPSVSIKAPVTSVQQRSNWNVVIDIKDASASSVDVTGIDVILTRTDGTFLYRVPRVSLNGTDGQTQRWTGRVQGKKITLPSQIKVKVTAVDRAGNAAIVQTATINVK